MELEILELLGKNPGLKARNLAKALGVPRSSVNSALYGSLSERVYRDEDFRWYLGDSRTREVDEELRRRILLLLDEVEDGEGLALDTEDAQATGTTEEVDEPTEYPIDELSRRELDLREANPLLEETSRIIDDATLTAIEEEEMVKAIVKEPPLVPSEPFSRTCLADRMALVLDRLKPREREVIELRFGLRDGHTRTLEEIGHEFSVTRERIRQIETVALRKLRHPTVRRELRRYIE